MYFNLLILSSILALPYIIWRRNGQPLVLFLSAALAWSCYGTWICLQHGLSPTFEFGLTEVTRHLWVLQLRVFGYFFGAFITLHILDYFRLAPNRMALTIAFWSFATSIFFTFALNEIFMGHDFPPIWYSTLNSLQLGTLAWVGYLPNAVSAASVLLFFAIVIFSLARRTPSAAKRALQYIRGL